MGGEREEARGKEGGQVQVLHVTAFTPPPPRRCPFEFPSLTGFYSVPWRAGAMLSPAVIGTAGGPKHRVHRRLTLPMSLILM